jgi:hypothetical protein
MLRRWRIGGEGIMPTIDVVRVRETASADPEFQIAARYWSGTVRLDVGPDVYVLRVQDGQITDFARISGSSGSFDLRIAAAPEEWDKLLEAVPPPFYVFISPVSASGISNFTVEGDMDVFYAYHAALRRFVEVMREVQSGRTGAPPVTVKRPTTARFDAAVGRYVYLTIDDVEYRVSGHPHPASAHRRGGWPPVAPLPGGHGLPAALPHDCL